MMLGCSGSLEENQFSSAAALSDASQTNPHPIKTHMVTEYWLFRPGKMCCVQYPKIRHIAHSSNAAFDM